MSDLTKEQKDILHKRRRTLSGTIGGGTVVNEFAGLTDAEVLRKDKIRISFETEPARFEHGESFDKQRRDRERFLGRTTPLFKKPKKETRQKLPRTQSP